MSRARKTPRVPSRRHSRAGRHQRPDGDARLEQLQRALLSLIAREGAPAVTHRAVAREAGVSLSATTYYFESKQEMIRSAFELLATQLRSQLEGLVARYGGEESGRSSPRQEVEAFADFVRHRVGADELENRTLLELLMAMVRDPDARARLGKDREEIRGGVVALLQRSHSGHPEEDADLLLSLVTGLVIESLVRGRPRDFDRRAARIAERVMGWIVKEG